MRLIKCDNHPDRDAIKTLSVKLLPKGSKPIFMGVEMPGIVLDLCEECVDDISHKITKLIKKS